MDRLTILRRRLSKIGINLSLVSNYPWIYLDDVNGNIVKEKHNSEHGFTIAIINLDGSIRLTESEILFKILKKYK